jgi:hypothetical protein
MTSEVPIRIEHGAPAAPGPVFDLYSKQLDILEHDLVTLAEAMPAERYDFRPTGGAFSDVRTFGEQVRHIATMLYMTAAIVLQEPTPHGPGKGNNGPDSVRTKAEALEYLRGALAYARKAVASLDERNQFDPITTYFGSQSRVEVAGGLAYHSYNHYGQMVVYARMSGVVPPGSVPSSR